eukprot:11531166-Alexandrium_andersonii.AAC.1
MKVLELRSCAWWRTRWSRTKGQARGEDRGARGARGGQGGGRGGALRGQEAQENRAQAPQG